MYKLLLFLILAAAAISAPAAGTQHSSATKGAADTAYIEHRYTEAARLYRALPHAASTADIQYNIGNAEYRQRHLAAAILAYQRALRLAPGHVDAQRNLLIARAHIEDRFAPPATPILAVWTANVVHSHSVASWTLWSLVSLLLSFAMMALYVVSHRMWMRKTGFFTALILLAVSIATALCAASQRYAFNHNTDAVVTTVTTLHHSPSSSARQLRSLHEGTTITIIDEGADGWLHVRLPDDNEGWIVARDIERVMPL